MRRASGWALLVSGCALPLLIITWPTASPGGRVGEACGVAAWTIAVVARDRQLRRRGSIDAMRVLRSGAAVLLVAQLLAVAAFDPLFFAFLNAPALLVVARLRFITDDASQFVGNFLLTIVCGGQALAWALVLGHAIRKARPALDGIVRSVRWRNGR